MQYSLSVFIHLVKLVDAAKPSIAQHKRPRFQDEFLGLWILSYISSESHSRAAGSGGDDASRVKFFDKLDELAFSGGRVAYQQNVELVAEIVFGVKRFPFRAAEELAQQSQLDLLHPEDLRAEIGYQYFLDIGELSNPQNSHAVFMAYLVQIPVLNVVIVVNVDHIDVLSKHRLQYCFVLLNSHRLHLVNSYHSNLVAGVGEIDLLVVNNQVDVEGSGVAVRVEVLVQFLKFYILLVLVDAVVVNQLEAAPLFALGAFVGLDDLTPFDLDLLSKFAVAALEIGDVHFWENLAEMQNVAADLDQLVDVPGVQLSYAHYIFQVFDLCYHILVKGLLLVISQKLSYVHPGKTTVENVDQLGRVQAQLVVEIRVALK